MKKIKLILIGVAFLLFNNLFAQSNENIKDFIKNLQNEINKKGAKWIAGETSLSNLSDEEKMRRVGLNFKPLDAPPITDFGSEELPAKLDWRDYKGNDYVTGIRDQGHCGSCWAFAMTAGLESYTLINKNMPGKDLDLSEQILISCSGIGSCDGGYLSPSFIKKTGLPEESFYPYTATDGNCSNAQANWQENTYKIASYGSVSQDLNKIKSALVKYGPLPTAMMVYEDFMHYTSGIYSYVSGKKLGGHAVFLVGYNDEEQYFIVKNSWGKKWGENGYFRIAYSEINSDVSFGLSTVAYKPASKDYSKKVEVVDLEGTEPVSPIFQRFNPAFSW